MKIDNRKDRLYNDEEKDKDLLFGDETEEERKKKNKKYKDNILIEQEK